MCQTLAYHHVGTPHDDTPMFDIINYVIVWVALGTNKTESLCHLLCHTIYELN